MANQIARIRNKIILFASITMVLLPALLLFVIPIVSDLTAETTRSTWLNFALFAPLLLIGTLFALRWYLRPISDLGYALEMGSTPTIELVTRARRIAFDAPIHFYGLTTLGAFVLSLVTNLVGTFLWEGYLFQEHLIPSLLTTTAVANVSLVIALVSRRWMRPVLLYTATRVQEGGTRIGIRTRLLVTMLTLILLALVFPGALGIIHVADAYREGLATKGEQLLAQALVATTEINQPSERLDRIAEHLSGQLDYDMLFLLDEKGTVHDPRYKTKPQLTFDAEQWALDKLARFRQARGSFVLLPIDTGAGPMWLGLGYIVHPLQSSEVLRTIFALGASGAVACAVALLTSHYLASDIAVNLIDITQRLRDVANGEHVDLSTHVPVVSLDEVGDLVLAYNALQKRVRLQQEQIEQKQRELSALQSLSYKIGTVRDTNYLMNEVIRDVERAFGYHNVSILIKEPDHEQLTFAATGLTDQRLRDKRFQIGEDGVVGRVAATGEPLLINDVSKCDFYIPDNTNTRSELAVPMIVGDQVLGVFNVSSERTGAFDDDDVRIVTALSNQIAIAIENARLLDTVLGSSNELERRARNLTILHNVSTALSTSLRLEDVLRVVTEQMVTLFEIGHCAVLLFTEEDEYAEIAAEHPARGWTGQQLQLKAFPLIQRVLAAPEPLLFADTQRSEQLRPLRENLQAIDARTALTVPLIAKGRVEGLVILSATGVPRPFTPEEMDICVTVASQVAVSLENVRLIDSLRLQATALADMARDVTAERSQLDAILRNLVDGLLVTDPKGRIILHNPAFLHLFGLNEQAIQAQVVTEIIPEMPLQSLIIQTIRAQVAHVQEMTLSDGRFFQITAAGVREEDELRVIVMVLRDVTRERQMDEMKTRFFSTVSHEFRTPLTPILGFTKLIRKSLNRSILPLLPPDEQGAQRAANRIDQNAGIIIDQVTRLSRLVEDVLFLADLDAGRLKWKSKEVDMGQILSTLADEIRPAAQKKELGLHTDWPADLPTVIGDASRLTRATRNLLDNAVKFTESGTVSVLAAHYRGQDQDVPLGLHIPGELAGPSLLVAVSDTGPGISPEAQQTLFERFGQGLHDLLTDKPSGTGLGLALSKEIINHHGGVIWVETEEGKGSTFVFALPLATQDIELELWGEKVSLPEAAPTILVVDDEPAVRELLYYLLLRAGYRTLMAVDGPTALNMARYHRPDLIILDIMIPGISGLDVTSVLKADAATKQIPIIILSIIADEKKAAELGASACFSKPFDQKELIDTVAELIHFRAQLT